MKEWIQKAQSTGEKITIPQTLLDWLKKPKTHYIDGKFSPPFSNKTFWTVHPGDGKKIAEVYEANQEDVSSAVSSAQKSFALGEWKNLTLQERSKVLFQIADLIDAHREELALLESLDTGKPIQEAWEGDIPRAAMNFRFFAEFSPQEKEKEKEIDFPGAFHHSACRESIGVVALITPWNLPLYLETWKLAPCLMMGNSCVLKPSELTPLTASYLAELIAQSDLPKGVFNLVHGHGENSTGQFLVSDSRVKAISFTGETTTGKAIMKDASSHLAKTSFELGGKGASVVFEDADLEAALEGSLKAAFRNQGEICLACPRLFVQESIYQNFLTRFIEKTSQIRVGNPLSFKTQMGALISKEHQNKVLGFIKEGSSGIRCGGKAIEPGFAIEPTVIEGLPLDHLLSQKEIFGPVVTVYSFKNEEEVVQAVNGVEYGLSASVWTRNPERIERLKKTLEVGLLWFNCWFIRDLRVPFGGLKQSGIGREGGRFSLDFFSEWKSVCTT